MLCLLTEIFRAAHVMMAIKLKHRWIKKNTKNYILRSFADLIVPSVNLAHRELNSLRHNDPAIWNSLPVRLKNIKSLLEKICVDNAEVCVHQLIFQFGNSFYLKR